LSFLESIKDYLRPFTESVLAILIGAFIGALIMHLSGYSATNAYVSLIKGAFFGLSNFAETLSKSTPLMLTALTFAVGARTGLFNIGAEGTVYFGAIAAVALTQFLPNPLVGILAAMTLGAAWALPAALLKVYRGVHEVISTIMLNWIAFWIVNWLSLSILYNPKDPNSTLPVPPSARLPLIVPNTSLSLGFVLAVLTSVAIFILMWYTRTGFELRASGYNSLAAKYGGINPKRSAIWSFVLGGITAGLAGAVLVMGRPPGYAITQGMANIYGYGFDGIGVALVGRNHPLGIIFAAILFGALNAGTTAMQQTGVPLEMVKIVEGIIIVAVAVPGLLNLVEKPFRALGGEQK